jgi:hypothetical protein
VKEKPVVAKVPVDSNVISKQVTPLDAKPKINKVNNYDLEYPRLPIVVDLRTPKKPAASAIPIDLDTPSPQNKKPTIVLSSDDSENEKENKTLVATERKMIVDDDLDLYITQLPAQLQ